MQYFAVDPSAAVNTLSSTQVGAIIVMLGFAVFGLFWLLMREKDKRLADNDKMQERMFEFMAANKVTLDALTSDYNRRRR